MPDAVYNFLSHIIWLLQEFTLLSTLIVALLLTAVLFLISYCVNVLGRDSKHKFWTKLTHFLKHDTATSFDTIAARCPQTDASYQTSYSKYRTQRHRIKHFTKAAGALAGAKLLIILLVLYVFPYNPLLFAKLQ